MNDDTRLDCSDVEKALENEQTEWGTHIKFVPGPPKPRTLTWWVVNRYEDTPLGWVAWFPRFRCYSFYPKDDTVYEKVCLREIASFYERKTERHKNKGG